MQRKDSIIPDLLELQRETIVILRGALKVYAENPGAINPKLIQEIRETVDSWSGGDGSKIPDLPTNEIEAKQPPFATRTPRAMVSAS
jgi:hypothetical protein